MSWGALIVTQSGAQCLSLAASQPGLNAAGERAEIGYPLQLIIWQFNIKVILEAGEEFESLQAVDAELLKKIIVRRQFLPRDFEVGGGEGQDFIECLVCSFHCPVAILTAFIGRISLLHHSFHNTLFWRARDNAPYICFNDHFALLVPEHRIRPGPVTVVQFSDRESTFYCVAKVNGLLEAKIHFRREPADLSPDLGEQAGNLQTMANRAAKTFQFRKALVKMHGIVIATDRCEIGHALLRKRA